VPQCDSYIGMDGTILEELVIPMMVSEYGWTKYRKVTQLAVLFRPKLVLINKFTIETGNKIDILNGSWCEGLYLLVEWDRIGQHISVPSVSLTWFFPGAHWRSRILRYSILLMIT